MFPDMSHIPSMTSNHLTMMWHQHIWTRSWFSPMKYPPFVFHPNHSPHLHLLSDILSQLRFESNKEPLDIGKITQLKKIFKGWSPLEGQDPDKLELTEIVVTIRSTRECNSKYSGGAYKFYLPQKLISSQYCATSDTNPGAKTSPGDSGGPSILR